MISYMVGKLVLNSTHSTRGWSNMSPGRTVFVPSPAKTGKQRDNPPPFVERLKHPDTKMPVRTVAVKT